MHYHDDGGCNLHLLEAKVVAERRWCLSLRTKGQVSQEHSTRLHLPKSSGLSPIQLPTTAAPGAGRLG